MSLNDLANGSSIPITTDAHDHYRGQERKHEQAWSQVELYREIGDLAGISVKRRTSCYEVGTEAGTGTSIGHGIVAQDGGDEAGGSLANGWHMDKMSGLARFRPPGTRSPVSQYEEETSDNRELVSKLALDAIAATPNPAVLDDGHGERTDPALDAIAAKNYRSNSAAAKGKRRAPKSHRNRQGAILNGQATKPVSSQHPFRVPGPQQQKSLENLTKEFERAKQTRSEKIDSLLLSSVTTRHQKLKSDARPAPTLRSRASDSASTNGSNVEQKETKARSHDKATRLSAVPVMPVPDQPSQRPGYDGGFNNHEGMARSASPVRSGHPFSTMHHATKLEDSLESARKRIASMTVEVRTTHDTQTPSRMALKSPILITA